MTVDCRRMFTNLYICSFVRRHTAQPPAELCEPIKGRSGVSTLASSPRAKLHSAELEGGQVLDWKLTAAPSLTPFLPSLSCFFLCFPFFTLFLIASTSLPLIPVQPFSLCLSHSPPPPPNVPHSSHCSLCFRATWQLSPGWLWRRMGCSAPLRRQRERGCYMKKPDARYMKASSQDETVAQSKLSKRTQSVLMD